MSESPGREYSNQSLSSREQSTSSGNGSGSHSLTFRVGLSNQRYSTHGERLVAGVVPLSEDLNYVLLTQSIRRKGWVLPKGSWESDETCEQAASRNAWEEAGITVQIGYTLDTIDKKQPSKAAAKDKAIYYFYQATVLEQYDEWPESHKRQRKWFTYSQAMEQLSSRPELQEALKKSTINQWSQEHTGTLGHQMQEERDIHDGRQGEDTAPLKSNGGDGDEFASVGSNTQGDQVLALTEKFSQSSHKTESVAEPGPQVKSQHDDDMGQITSIVVALSSPGVEPVTDVSSDSDLGKKSTTRQGFQDRAAEPVSPPALSRSLTLPFMPQESLKAYSSKEIGIGSQDAAQSPDGSSSSLPSSDDTMRDSDTTSKEELKATVLNRLMRHFYEMISSQQGQKEATEGSDGSSHGVQPSHLTNSTTDSVGRSYFSNRAASSSEQQGAGGRLRNTQRKRPAGDDDGANDGEDDQAGRAPKQPRASEPQDRLYPHLAKHLACPYFKNDPMREHPARSCLGPGWVYVPRIKEHLYRCHAQLINCPRCHEIFNTDQAKDEHTAAEVRCEALTRGAPLEGFNLTQEKLLRSKKKAHKQMTEEEKWMEVYLILFPDLDPENLPTPYYEYSDLKQGKSGSPASELSRYEAFLRRELPLRVRQQLEVRIDEALSPIGEVLRAQLVEIVRDMQLELFTIYKSLKTRANDPVGSASSGGGESDHHNARDAPPEGPSAGEQHPELATALELVASSGMESHVEAQAAGSSWDWSLTLEQQLARLPPLPPDAGEDLGHFNGLLFNFE